MTWCTCQVEGDAVLGEAAVLLNTRHLVTTLAADVCELWFVPKEDLDVVLMPWPQLRRDMMRRGMAFLEDVIDCYSDHGHESCPESAFDMIPDARDIDELDEDALKAPGKAPRRKLYLGPEALVATMVGAEPTPPTPKPVFGSGGDAVSSAKSFFGSFVLGARDAPKGSPRGRAKTLDDDAVDVEMTATSASDNGRPLASSDAVQAATRAGASSGGGGGKTAHFAVGASGGHGDEGGDASDVNQALLDGSMSPRDLFRATGMFHPEASSKMAWDIVMCTIILYSVVTITYQIGFSDAFTGTLAMVDHFVDIIFALDILVSFNTACVDRDGRLISDRAAVTRLYLRGWFPIDFVSTVPIDLIVVWSSEVRHAKPRRSYMQLKPHVCVLVFRSCEPHT